MPKIVTLTVNTAIDLFITVNHLLPGENIVADANQQFASGKGINVAKSIASMQLPVKAMGFVGRKSLAIFASLNAEFLTTEYTVVAGKTRTNITLFDTHQNQETHIRTTGYSINHTNLVRLISMLECTLQNKDIVILSGSLPQGVPDDFYKTVIELCHRKCVLTFLDCSGVALSFGLLGKPYFVKPNQQELEEWVGAKLSNKKQIIAAAQGIIELGVSWVVVSRGEKGIIVLANNEVYTAVAKGPLTRPLTTVGCGDAMVAGFAIAKLQGYAITESIQWGITSATASLYSVDPGHLEKNMFAQLKNKFTIQQI